MKAIRTIAIASIAVLAALALAPVSALAQGQPSALSRVAGIYDSTRYAGWGAYILAGNTATGSQTITVCPWLVLLPDGRQISPWSTTVPISIDPQNSAVAETVTPTAVSITYPGSGVPLGTACAAVTATFANTHGPSFNPMQVGSGDQGVNEAINDASNNGGGDVYFQIDSGSLTLSTSGQSTTFGVNLPTRSVIAGAMLRVTTTITGCTGGWSLGYSTGTEFTAANTTLTAGTTTDSSTINAAVAFNAAATKPTVFCTTAAASAGVVHARVWGYKHAASAF